MTWSPAINRETNIEPRLYELQTRLKRVEDFVTTAEQAERDKVHRSLRRWQNAQWALLGAMIMFDIALLLWPRGR